jgi:transposase
MPRISHLIDDVTYENACKELKSYGNAAKISVKLKAIIAARKHGISKVAEIFGITRKSLMKWINDFKVSGPDQLRVQSGRGRKPKVSNQQLEEIKSWVLLNANITTKELVLQIRNIMGLELSVSTVNRILKKIII